jgi:glycosyltransferase involved in cell wall biosynthesis
MNVAMLLSCGSFEGFFGGIQGQSRKSYLESYRNDWSWYYARGLLESGVQPLIYMPALHESGRYETDAGIPVRFLQTERWFRPFEQVWLKRLSRQTRWSLYVEELVNTVAFMRALRQALREDDIDLLYVQEYWSARFDYLVREIDLPVTGADHGGVWKGVVKLFKRAAFEKAALCYSQTRQECGMVERYGGRSKFQPNGCDVSFFFPDPTVSRSKTVLTVTRLTNKQKRTTDLVRAIAELPADWSLDIVGTGPDRGMLEKLAADLDLSTRVRFHGFVDHTRLRDFFRRCGVYAMPSAQEAVALAALEAMACGAVPVLSQIPSFAQLVENGVNGRLVPVGDVKGLAAGILDAWQSRDALGHAASTTVQSRYSKAKLYADLADSLRSCVAGEAVRRKSGIRA